MCFYGRNMMMGYLGRADKTAETVTDLDNGDDAADANAGEEAEDVPNRTDIKEEKKWMKTGDIARRDGNGFYYITGEVKVKVTTKMLFIVTSRSFKVVARRSSSPLAVRTLPRFRSRRGSSPSCPPSPTRSWWGTSASTSRSSYQ